MPLRTLLVHPGADISVCDVFNGLAYGLRMRGIEVREFALNNRIAASAAFLHFAYRKAKAEKKPIDKPSDEQVLFKAGSDIVIKALSMQADLVLIVSAMYLHPNILLLLKRAGLKTGILFTESPYMDESQARLVPLADVAWTNERVSAAEMGIKYLRHAWHPEIHTPSVRANDPAVPAHDVVFVGTAFQERIDLLEAVDWRGIDLGLYGEWGMLTRKSPLKPFVKPGYVQNAHAAALYQRAKIGLNLHRTSKGFGKHCAHIAHAESLNPRAYELAATGCFMLSDYRPEVAEVFGASVPTFRSAEEVRPLIDRWVCDDSGRRRAAMEAQSRVQSDTWLARAGQILVDIADSGIVASGDRTQQSVAAVGG